jgi:NAD(P)-dependent dehydrogenase (short-subunit alcohol dehydrogenase family)
MSARFRLDGQKILITGAAGGIGTETAKVCASLGASLVLVDLSAPEHLAKSLGEGGACVDCVAVDVTDRAAVEAAVAAAGPLDGIVANAGYCPWDDWTDEGWDDVFTRVIDVNVSGVLHVVRAALPGLKERKRGRIVIVSSMAARMGGLAASPHYVAAKGGASALVRWMARSFAPHGISVNGVAPGATATPMTQNQVFNLSGVPLQRMAHPSEIAHPIAFLCSDAASYVCGTMLDVNGGAYMN